MKKDLKTYLIAVISFCLISQSVWAQVPGDFRTNTTPMFTGNWNDTNTWERYNGLTWDSPGTGSDSSPALIPTSTNSVWIQTGAIIMITQSESCKDLHICASIGSSPNTSAMGIIDIASYTLNVNGKFVCYYGGLGAVETNSTNGYAQYPFTGTSGKVSVVGNTRILTNTGEWSATIQTQNGIFPLEINLSSGIIIMQTGLTCSSFSLGNNTFDIAGTTLNINGDFTAGSSGAIKSNGSGSVSITGTGALTSPLKFDQTIPGTTNRVQDFTLNRTSSGSATLGNTLEVAGTLTLTNGTLTTGGFLTLVSKGSGVSETARVGSIPGTADISGIVKVQRYVPPVTRRYRMFSPNTTGFAFSDMKDNIFVSGQGGTANGFDSSATNSSTIYTYQESTTGGRGWKPITNIAQTLSAGDGALVFVRGDRTLPSPDWYIQNNSSYPSTGGFPAQNAVTIDFNGPINKGPVSPTITYNSTIDPTSDGWNLVGNPYPSQIDWNVVLTNSSNLDANYYILDPSTGSYVSDNGSNNIASGQAFFVRATASSPGITFTESAKVGTSPTNYFKTSLPQIEIKMVKDSVNSDVAWLEFNSTASKGFIRGEDALKFHNSLINFGFYIDSVFTTQRNSVPMPLIADTFIMSVYAAAGTFTLQFANIKASLPASKNIYLKDLFNSNVINLKNTATYLFSITSNPASSGNRFQLIINDPSMLPVKLVEFYAEKDSKEKDVILHWSSSSEKNSDRFIIERSIDNTNDFTEIGIVAAKSNSQTTMNYQFNDQDIPDKNAQTIFYRLKQIDKDGSSVYSKIVSLNLLDIEDKSLTLYPNPASATLNIKPASQIQGDMKIAVYNIVGKCIMSHDIFVIKGQDITMDISQVQAGVYIVKLMHPLTGNQSFTKFTKD